MSDKLKVIEGLIRSEPLNYNFGLLDDRLKNAKASVLDFESLPLQDNDVGDYRLVTGLSKFFWWNGNGWLPLEVDTSQIKRGDVTLNSLLDLMFTEIGENSNGNFARLGSGLQICWNILHIPTVSFSANGSIYRSDDYFEWVYPRTFISTPVTNVDVNITNDWASRSSADPRENLRFRMFSTTGGDDTSVYAHCLAIGRWK